MAFVDIILYDHTIMHISTSATVNAEIYRNEVCGPHVKLYKGEIDNNFLQWMIMNILIMMH